MLGNQLGDRHAMGPLATQLQPLPLSSKMVQSCWCALQLPWAAAALPSQATGQITQMLRPNAVATLFATVPATATALTAVSTTWPLPPPREQPDGTVTLPKGVVVRDLASLQRVKAADANNDACCT